MVARAGISGPAVALMATGGVLVWSGLNNTGLLDTLRALAKGQAPTANRKPPFQPIDSGSAPGSDVVSIGGGLTAVVAEARRWLGTKYVYGGCHGSFPSCCKPGNGVDCSSFVSCVMKRVGLYTKSTSMVAGSSMLAWGTKVPESQVQPGYVVLWVGQHCGIVTNPQTQLMIAAPHTGDVVKEYSYNFSLPGHPKVFLKPPSVQPGGGSTHG